MKIDKFRDEFFFLSNFYPIELEIDGKKYKSSEHYYQACKALDEVEHDMVRDAATPAASKKVARMIDSFNKNWHDVRLGVMRKALSVKFAIPKLREALLMTGDAELIEGNWWKDTYWGVCNGVGENNLGKILMELREEFKSSLAS